MDELNLTLDWIVQAAGNSDQHDEGKGGKLTKLAQINDQIKKYMGSSSNLKKGNSPSDETMSISLKDSFVTNDTEPELEPLESRPMFSEVKVKADQDS